jgi:hypothetical protein
VYLLNPAADSGGFTPMLSKISLKKIPSLRLCLLVSGAVLVLSPFYQSISPYFSYANDRHTSSSMTDSQKQHRMSDREVMSTPNYHHQGYYPGGGNIFWQTLIPNALLIFMILGVDRALDTRDRNQAKSDESAVIEPLDPIHKYHIQIYKIALKESLTSGGIKLDQSMETLKEMRQILKIGNEDHYTVLTELISENSHILYSQYSQTPSTTTSINPEPSHMQRTTIRRNPKAIATNNCTKISHHPIANYSSHENQSTQS